MCYSISNNKEDKKLQVRYNKKMDDIVKKLRHPALYLNGFGYPNLAVITSENSDSFSLGKWGLVPSFIKDDKSAKEYASYTLNAKAETIFTTKSYKNVVTSKRCLIPVTGFYEWMDLNKNKYPHHILLKDSELFSLGGVYDEWTNAESGETRITFSIITTEANPLMAKIHNLKKRMPLIFTPDVEMDWLSPDLTKENIESLMKPLDEKLMDAFPIKKFSTKGINPNSEDFVTPFEYPELALID